MGITHSTVVVVPDDPAFPVGTDEWNDAHVIAAATITAAQLAPDASALTVSDEGTPLDTAVSSLDFTGPGVTASVVGHAVTVGVARWELLMSPGITNPPEPLSNGTGDDWLWVQVP